MKKFATLALTLALLAGNGAYAQTQPNGGAKPPAGGTAKPSTGSGARAATYSYDDFAWGIGLGALVIVGVVVGVTVAGALGSQSNHAH